MPPAIAGSLSALCLGTADFAARFATRAFGAPSVLLAVFGTSFAMLCLYGFGTGTAFPTGLDGLAYAGLNGIATAGMTVLLYVALARGPVTVVAPIVASHPALVVAFWVTLGATPTPVEWAGMAATLAGAVVVARAAVRRAEPEARGDLRTTIAIAGAACLAYVFLVAGGQMAASHYRPFEALWLGRAFSLGAAILLVPFARALGLGPVRVPRARAWLPLAGLGALDATGYLFLFLGSTGDGKSVAAVTGSAFGAVTVLLGRFVLKERMAAAQWAGVAMVGAGVAVLAGSN